jgi:hypothetical protein
MDPGSVGRRNEDEWTRFGVDVSVRHVVDFAATYRLPLVSVGSGRADLEWAALGDDGCVCVDQPRPDARIAPSFGTVAELVAARPDLVGACVVFCRHGVGDDDDDDADDADWADGADDDRDDDKGDEGDHDDGVDDDDRDDDDPAMDAVEMLQPAAVLVLDVTDECRVWRRFDDFLYGQHEGYVTIHETRLDEPASRWTVSTGNHGWLWLQTAPSLPKLVAPCGPPGRTRAKHADELCVIC